MPPSPIWHPFTQHGLVPAFPMIEKAEGAWLSASDGRQILDAISSWWVITHGHCHPCIVSAVQRQAAQLDQLIFANYTHPMAEEVAQAILPMVPQGLTHLFFADSGSASVEVALKMALGYWQHVGEKQRKRIVVLEHGYHGDSIGAMSVGERGIFNQAYAPLLFEVIRIPFPYQGQESHTFEKLFAACATQEAAAFIAEPLILGAGGMLMYEADIWAQMAHMCASHHVLLIADEVMTGWGRAGTLFACEQAGVTPDILCTSKGLTGGMLPLAITLCKPMIYEAHYSQDRQKTFFHSSSFTANPLACAAALANIKIWQEEPVLARLENVMQFQAKGLKRLEGDTRFENLRQKGTITALDMRVGDKGYLAQMGPQLYDFCEARGVLLRPLGQTIYVMPPYCIKEEECDHIYDVIGQAADHLMWSS